jgi:methylase of polypeptide subunit release factors
VAERTFRSESQETAPTSLVAVDDRLTAAQALARVRAGEWLHYTGTFGNLRQLLQAMARRLPEPKPAATALEAFRAERRARLLEHQTLSRVLVSLDGAYRLELSGAPDVAQACRDVWGAGPAEGTLVAFKTLQGMLGAAEWRRKGLEVPGLKGRLTPHYGVYGPTRADYVELLTQLPQVSGKRVIDVGTGTGVLSFVLLQKGAGLAWATDVDPRAVACATENAQQLGLSGRFVVREQAFFPDEQADLVVCNPPWIPEPPKNRVDRAVFDEGSAVLSGFLEGLAAHLLPQGRGVLLLSDLAVRLGLRAPDFLQGEFDRCGLTVVSQRSTQAKHGRAKDRSDPLHVARSAELTTMYVLQPR